MKNKINYSLKLVEHDGDYELLDTGDRAKLERYGDVVLARPDPEALWKKADETAWDKADARFVRKGSYTKWMEKKELSKEWQIKYGGFTFLIRPTTYKHTGIFPEQLENWKWLAQQVRSNKEKRKDGIKVLNLFVCLGF